MCRPQKAEGAFPQRQALPVSLLPKVARHPFPAPFLFHRKAFPSSDAIAQGSRRYDEQGVSVRPPAGGIGSLLAQYAGVVVGQFRSGVRRGVVEYRLLWRAAFDSLCPCPVADTQGKETFSLIQAVCGVLLALLVSTVFVWVGHLSGAYHRYPRTAWRLTA